VEGNCFRFFHKRIGTGKLPRLAVRHPVKTLMRLAVFDLDNTLLTGDSDYLWGQFLVERGLVDRVCYERENMRFYEEYKAGTLDIHEFCRFSLAPLAEHDLATLLSWREQFVRDKILPIVAPLSRPLLERHRSQGEHLLITTATNRFVTEPIAELLGVDTLIATDPEFAAGRYTGRIAGLPNFQAGKVVRLEQWIAQQGGTVEIATAYSDSRNDLPLLERAQYPVAVDPDDVLRAEAVRRGWPVISLRGEAPPLAA
jgi:HAD superfamily hydrolase (TIGR01490 family)